MALRGIKPTAVPKRLKAFFYGKAGVGKTTAAIQFPRPYVNDGERGTENTQYIKLLEKGGGVLFQTSDFDELLKEVKALLTESHPYKTFVIDPLTTIYNDLLEKCAVELKNKSTDLTSTGTEHGRHYGLANKRMKHLLNLLLRLDMNVIITSHAKEEYSGGKETSLIGQTFDCYKKLDYVFDLVFEIQKRGSERVAIIKKSRVENFPDGETFPFSYEEIANRYGRDILEKDAVAQNLADEKQVIELKRLVDLLKVPEEIVEKWLTKANAEAFEEMEEQAIQKCIEFLQAQIKGEAA